MGCLAATLMRRLWRLVAGRVRADRVEGRDDVFDHLHDVRAVVVAGLGQVFQVAQELRRVERDRLADVDEIVLGLSEALLSHELLLVELLAAAQAGVDDRDISLRLEAGQADQVAGQVVDLHRLTHVEDEDLAAPGVGACLQDQTHRFRDGHEVADDVRVGDCHRAAGLDLLLKERDDGAVAAQYIPKADGDELRAGSVLVPGVFGTESAFFGGRAGKFRFLLCGSRAVVDGHVVFRVVGDLSVDGLVGVGVQERQQVHAARLADGVHALDDHLAEALAGAHDVGRIHCLVGADEYEALRAVL